MLHICTKFCQTISNGLRATDPNTRVDARVVANVDGWTDVRTKGRKAGASGRRNDKKDSNNALHQIS